MIPETKTKILKALKLFLILLVSIGVLTVGGTVGYKKYGSKLKPKSDPYLAFFDEVYDTIKNNYWDTITDEQLGNLYVLAAQKINNTTYPDKPESKKDTEKFIKRILSTLDSD